MSEAYKRMAEALTRYQDKSLLADLYEAYRCLEEIKSVEGRGPYPISDAKCSFCGSNLEERQ